MRWGTEQAERERQRAERERQRAERLMAQLRAAGIETEGLKVPGFAQYALAATELEQLGKATK